MFRGDSKTSDASRHVSVFPPLRPRRFAPPRCKAPSPSRPVSPIGKKLLRYLGAPACSYPSAIWTPAIGRPTSRPVSRYGTDLLFRRRLCPASPASCCRRSARGLDWSHRRDPGGGSAATAIRSRSPSCSGSSPRVAIIACDVAEVLGSALALNLMFNLPLWLGIVLTGFDNRHRAQPEGAGDFRQLEAIVLGLVGTIFICFTIEILMLQPAFADVAGRG